MDASKVLLQSSTSSLDHILAAGKGGGAEGAIYGKMTSCGSSRCVCGDTFTDGALFCHKCGARHPQDPHAQLISLFREAMGVICEDIAQATREMTLLRQDVALGMSGVSAAVQGIQKHNAQMEVDTASVVQEEMQRLYNRMDAIDERRPELDLDPIISALEQNNSMHKTVQQIRFDVEALVSRNREDVDLSPVLEAIQRQRTEAVDLSPVLEAIQRHHTEVDFDPIIDAIQGQTHQVDLKCLEQSIDKIIRQLMAELGPLSSNVGFRFNKSEVDLSPILTTIEHSKARDNFSSIHNAMQQDSDDVDLLPYIKALQGSKIEVDFAPVIAAVRQVRTEDDLAPILLAIRQNNNEVDLLPVIHAIEQNASNVNFAPVIAAVSQNKAEISLTRIATLIQQNKIDLSPQLFGRLK